MERRFSHIVRVRVEFLLGGKSRFSYCWESVGSTRFSYCWESGGRSLSRTVGSCRAENQFPHIVGSRWEGHFLILLGVVGHFFHIVGNRVRLESHFSHVVENWWEFVFCMLLGICETVYFSHIVRGRVEFLILSGVRWNFSYCWEPVGRSLSHTVGDFSHPV